MKTTIGPTSVRIFTPVCEAGMYIILHTLWCVTVSYLFRDDVRGTYLSYLRNLIFDEHVFIQLKEKRTVSRFYFYKKVDPGFPR